MKGSCTSKSNFVLYQLLAWLKRYCNNTIFECDIWTEIYLFSKFVVLFSNDPIYSKQIIHKLVCL